MSRGTPVPSRRLQRQNARLATKQRGHVCTGAIINRHYGLRTISISQRVSGETQSTHERTTSTRTRIILSPAHSETTTTRRGTSYGYGPTKTHTLHAHAYSFVSFFISTAAPASSGNNRLRDHLSYGNMAASFSHTKIFFKLDANGFSLY
ncbi:hypothetical protein KQX54_009411 [Cotesia glomerata]|uniref:Uncharacterized protein n=1 Tax=Cotesia glomerata TaxID=32391 RepID=A0AAV7J5A0_COTGL|nr:hypothetical protein KQX54_009411 [Cotesia glomerata]